MLAGDLEVAFSLMPGPFIERIGVSEKWPAAQLLDLSGDRLDRSRFEIGGVPWFAEVDL